LHHHHLIAVKLNANRHVTGTLRGFDPFMNIVLDNTVDMKAKQDIGMVVRSTERPMPWCQDMFPRTQQAYDG
jgi:small nuclear ribonucleoprotein (snRNP)-like protein